MSATVTQHWDPVRYQQHARFVSDLGSPLVELLAPQAGERILDLGCGDGVLTARLAASGATVMGVDASSEFVAAARARGLDARELDGQALPFAGEFDAVFSNAALHWMKRDPDGVVRGVARSLRPGGRFVSECGGFGNVAAIRTALHAVCRAHGLDPAERDPWYFATGEECRDRLEKYGFKVSELDVFPRPTLLPGDLSGWLETMAGAFLSGVDTAQSRAMLAGVRELLRPALCAGDGRWQADYVRLRFIAVKPG